MKASPEMNCTNCDYHFEKSQLEGGGHGCNFNPPSVIVIAPGQGLSMFPTVNERMICGGYENETSLIIGDENHAS